MALRNAFELVATESTLDDIKVDQSTVQRELLQDILSELKTLNLYMSMIYGEELNKHDLDMEKQ
jgi:hypothetical protein